MIIANTKQYCACYLKGKHINNKQYTSANQLNFPIQIIYRNCILVAFVYEMTILPIHIGKTRRSYSLYTWVERLYIVSLNLRKRNQRHNTLYYDDYAYPVKHSLLD